MGGHPVRPAHGGDAGRLTPKRLGELNVDGGVSLDSEAPLSSAEHAPLVRMPRSGQSLHDPQPAARVAETLTARIEMLGVSKAFPGVRALDHVDFRVESGEVHALMGENGAGKSTLIKIMTGALSRDEGEIRIDGRPVDIGSPGQARALGIGTVYQEVNLVPTMSVTKNLTLGRQPRRFGLISWREARSRRPRAAEAAQVSTSTSSGRSAPIRWPSSNSSRSRARSKRTRGFWCSTSRPRASTPTRPSSSSDPARPQERAASRSSSSPISSTRCTRSPTAYRCCATAAWSGRRDGGAAAAETDLADARARARAHRGAARSRLPRAAKGSRSFWPRASGGGA